MADTGIFCSQAEMLQKAGANVSTIISGDATFVYSNSFISQAEALINADVTYNFSDAYATLNADVAPILKIAASAKSAIMCISYDQDAIGRTTAIARANVLMDEYERAIQVLKDKRKQGFIKNA